MKTITVLAFAALLITQPVQAQVPQLVNYQGRVAVGGVNFEGTGQFKFALVDGGTNTASTAKAVVSVDGTGKIKGVSVTIPGSGYSSPPMVTFTDPGGSGSGATATAVVGVGGIITAINVTNAGSGYLPPGPLAMIADPPPAYVYNTYWSNDKSLIAGSGNTEPTNAVSLTVTKGLYSVPLGDASLANMTGIPTGVFNNPDVRLRVWFNDGIHGSQLLAPDQRLAAVGYAMIATTVPDGAITSNKLANGAVGSAQLAASAVQMANIAAGAVAGNAIANGAIGNAQLAAGAVMAANIAAGQIVKSINGLMDGVTISAGTNVTLSATGNTLTFAAPNVLTTVTHDASLSGFGTTGSPLSVAPGSAVPVPLVLTSNVNPTISSTNTADGIAIFGVGTNGTAIWGETTDGGSGVTGLARSDGDGVDASSHSGNGVYATSTNGFGVRAFSSNSIGVFGQTNAAAPNIAGVYGGNTAVGGTGVVGQAYAINGAGIAGVGDTNGSKGVYGRGQVDGVFGETTSGAGTGVYGLSNIGYGVLGASNNNNGVTGTSSTGWGVYGLSNSNIGVQGISNGGDGVAGRTNVSGHAGVSGYTAVDGSNGLVGYSDGNGAGIYGRGTVWGAWFDGNVRVVGTAEVNVLQVDGADLAEPFKITGQELPSGSVVVIDDQTPGQLKLSDRAYDTRVAGILSGANGIHAGISLTQRDFNAGGQNVALSGRVYVLADAANSPIQPGDLLTTSDSPGRAMKVTDHLRAQGAILGKAMSALDEGTGVVLVLVSLQ